MDTATIKDILSTARISETEFRQEIAVLFFQKEKITLAQAAHIADMPLLRFQHLLASREIPIHYGIDEFEEDLETLKKLEIP